MANRRRPRRGVVKLQHVWWADSARFNATSAVTETGTAEDFTHRRTENMTILTPRESRAPSSLFKAGTVTGTTSHAANK